jgi:hypothetical protein
MSVASAALMPKAAIRCSDPGCEPVVWNNP